MLLPELLMLRFLAALMAPGVRDGQGRRGGSSSQRAGVKESA